MNTEIVYKCECGNVAEKRPNGRIRCDVCWSKDVKAESKFQDSLPQLQGSDKQVAWAIKIREPIARELTQIKQTALIKLQDNSIDPLVVEQVNSIIIQVDTILNKSSASWWIDNRDTYIWGTISWDKKIKGVRTFFITE